MSYWPEPSNPHFNLGEKLRDVAPLGPAPSIREPVPLTAHAQPITGARGFHFLGHWVVGGTFVHPLVLLAGVHNLEVS